jgi:hypothetical protein
MRHDPLMTENNRAVSIVGGPHDGMNLQIPAGSTSIVLWTLGNKPQLSRPLVAEQRIGNIYTQRGADRIRMVYRADMVAK